MKKRNIDFFTLSISSFIFYTLPTFWGTTWTSQNIYYSVIHTETYFVVDSILIFLFITMILFDKTHKEFNFNFKDIPYDIIGYFVLSFSYLNFLLVILRVGIDPFLATDKTVLSTANINPFFALSIWSSMISLMFGSIKNNFKIIIFSLFILLLSLFLGIRSYFVIGIISLFLILNVKKRRVRLYRAWRYILFIIGVGFFSTLIRKVYPIIKKMNFGELLLLLKNKDFYLSRMFIIPSEILNVFSTLNLSVHQKLDLGFNFIILQIIDWFPFAKEIFGLQEIRFSRVIMNRFYINSRYGMGSNIWAEMYSSGGFVTLYLFLFVWLLTIVFLSNSMIKFKSYLPFIIPYGVYITFYINRLSFSLVIGPLKYFIFIFLVTKIFYTIFLKPYIK